MPELAEVLAGVEGGVGGGDVEPLLRGVGQGTRLQVTVTQEIRTSGTEVPYSNMASPTMSLMRCRIIVS